MARRVGPWWQLVPLLPGRLRGRCPGLPGRVGQALPTDCGPFHPARGALARRRRGRTDAASAGQDMKPGTLYQNGHGRCGGCSVILDALVGGRRARKRQGWTYTGRDVLGWVCGDCSRFVFAWERRQDLERRPPHVGKRSYLVDKSDGARGFGAARPETVGVTRRLRNRRRKLAQRERRAQSRDRSGRAALAAELDRQPSSQWQTATSSWRRR